MKDKSQEKLSLINTGIQYSTKNVISLKNVT